MYMARFGSGAQFWVSGFVGSSSSSHSENAPRAKRHLDNYGSEWSNIWPYSYLGVPEWIENAIGSILFMALAKKKPQRRVLGGY